jgi:hypothetical protein
MARKPSRAAPPKEKAKRGKPALRGTRVDAVTGLTARQEKFVQHLALHGDNTAAFRHAFDTSAYKDSTVWQKACVMAGEPKVQARFSDLRKAIQLQAKEKFDIDANWLLCELGAIAKQKASDYSRLEKRRITVKGKGPTAPDREIEVDHVEFVPTSQLTPQQLRSVASIGMTVTRSGQTIPEIKMHCKYKAIEKLCVLLGLSSVNLNVTGSVTVDPPALDNADLRDTARDFEQFRKSLVVVN